MFHNRYMLEKVIGRGSFGQVVRAYDTRTKAHVAIKIIKNNALYVEQALSEVRMTAYLNRIDPDDGHAIMRIFDKFIFRGHQCLVLELLSFSLYDLLRSTEFYGVSLNLVRKFCRQILNCLAFLSRPDVNIAHCDLKPENVLLRHPQRSAIKVVDFGASCRVSDTMFTYVQSRFYRAPEVILGIAYDTQVDVWSLGCMLVELHTGYPLFAGRDEADQMAVIVERLGMPPKHILDAGKKTHLFFDKVRPGIEATAAAPGVAEAETSTVTMEAQSSVEAMTETSTEIGSEIARTTETASTGAAARDGASSSATDAGLDTPGEEEYVYVLRSDIGKRPGEIVPGSKPIQAFVDDLTSGSSGKRKRASGGHSESDYEVFLELAKEMLRFDPDERIAATAALENPFVSGATLAGRKSMSGRDSPKDMPPTTGAVDANEEKNPGRAAPVQSRVPAMETSSSSATSVGGTLRLSKSESAIAPVPAPMLIFHSSDWAEEVGIEPPAWRAGGVVGLGSAHLRRLDTGDDEDSLVCAHRPIIMPGAGSGMPLRLVRRLVQQRRPTVLPTIFGHPVGSRVMSKVHQYGGLDLGLGKGSDVPPKPSGHCTALRP